MNNGWMCVCVCVCVCVCICYVICVESLEGLRDDDWLYEVDPGA